jgi:hypothetical protein
VKGERVRDRFMPWGGLIGGTLGAGLAHQIGAATTFENCAVGSPWTVFAGTIIGLAFIGAGAFASWREFVRRESSPRRMIATVSLMAAVLFALAVLLPVIAALVIPSCWA